MSTLHSIACPQLQCDIGLQGAEMLSLRTSTGTELLWQRDPRWWDRSAPILFPIIGIPRDGEVVYHGRRHPMPKHGIAPNAQFGLVSKTQDRCVLELRDDATSRAHFPFPFVLTVSYTVLGSRLEVLAKVLNPGREPIPAALGFHPGFVCDPGAADGYTLDFGTDDLEPFLRGGVIRQTTDIPVSTRRFPLTDRDFLDGALVVSPYRGSTVTLEADAVPLLRMRTHNLGTLGIWRKPGAPYICIEPWSGLPVSMSAPGQDLCDSDTVDWVPGNSERIWGMEIETTP